MCNAYNPFEELPSCKTCPLVIFEVFRRLRSVVQSDIKHKQSVWSSAVTISSALSRPARWRPAAAVGWAGWWKQKRFHLFSLLPEQERRWWRSLVQWHTSQYSRCRCQNRCCRHLRGKKIWIMCPRSKLNIWLHATTLKQTLCQKSKFWQCKTINVLWKFLQWKQLRLH